MPSEITIGNLSAKPGERKSGWLEIGYRPASRYSLPLTIINGANDGPVLTIISAQHGTEYVGIAAALQIIRTVDPKSLSGAILVVPVVNVAGFEQRTRLAFPIEDDFSGTRNLNRLWPGDPNGSLAHQTIYYLFEKVVRKGQYLLDLHGGDIYENLYPCTMITSVGNSQVDATSKTLAEVIGYEYIIESSAGSGDRGRSKTEAPLIGIPAVVVETGDQGKYDEKLVQKAFNSVLNVMRYLKMVSGNAVPRKDYRIVYDMVKVKAKTGGLFVQTTPVGSIVKKGDKLGQVISIADVSVENVVANESGLVIESFCNPAVHSGETLVEIGLLK